MNVTEDPERRRLREERTAYLRWGPYLSERQWGTVREDYSADGNAWAYFPFDHAHLRAYRWGEDGIAGFCDDQARVCLGLALWNGRDPILKERLFGLANEEGNHGEDVKELYYYLDATPTHSYSKMLYKYPHATFPYRELRDQSASRGRHDGEFEVVDTGVFDEGRYFDVFVEYARGGPDDILVRITAHNRGPEPAELHLIPQLWFRNTWAWSSDDVERPSLQQRESAVDVRHPDLPPMRWRVHVPDGSPVEHHFCDNETNPRLWGRSEPGAFKDGVGLRVLHGKTDAVRSDGTGTKCGAQVVHTVADGESFAVWARLRPASDPDDDFGDFEAVFDARIAEADAFYAVLQRDLSDPERRNVQRQALAGMMWTKQFYYWDIPEWLAGDPTQPAPPRDRWRNRDWEHLNNADIISMPDCWEYPWYAAWDLAFHCLPLALIDPAFAKHQLELLTKEWYMHPNGQLPAYEWALSDVNPPVHAWAAHRVFQIERAQLGEGATGDLDFLERIFHKMMLNFTWWVNRKDDDGNNVFQGGFLGLDNIGVFDRSEDLPGNSRVEQSDGTGWMAMYCLNMMRIALELSERNENYEHVATKFFEHFLYIAKAMTEVGGAGLWDEEDRFYYDCLHLESEGQHRRLPMKVRSMVGLIPLFAVEVLDPELLDRHPGFKKRLEWFLDYRPDLYELVSHWNEPGVGERRLLSVLRGSRMKALIRRMVDEAEFLSPYGVRSMSRVHDDEPYRLTLGDEVFEVRYSPAESTSSMFGGNSNWRGPVWFPVNYLLVESLQRFHHYFGDDFLVECPTGSGQMMTLLEISEELTERLVRLFLPGEDGCRPIHRHSRLEGFDPHFANLVLFYEYFHGDTGRGVGASHQTGWTGLVAKLLQPRRPVAKPT